MRGIGPDSERGRDGWVYKIGRRAGTTGAADPSGPFGRGKLRRGARVLWFWCVQGAATAASGRSRCRPASTVAPGAMLRVTVRGYDDNGRGVPVGGRDRAPRLGDRVTGADGVARHRAARAAVRG